MNEVDMVNICNLYAFKNSYICYYTNKLKILNQLHSDSHSTYNIHFPIYIYIFTPKLEVT